MTIAKGQPWGRKAALPDGAPEATDDSSLRRLVEPEVLAGRCPTVGLLGGDLARTCGAPGDRARLHTADAVTLPVDAVEVRMGDVTHVAVAHVVVRRSWWHGPVVAAMNAQFLGPWDVAPRSHPNDGRVDLLRGDLSLGDRWKARGRLPLGAHVPHPDIDERRTKAVTIEVPRGHRVRIDGAVVAHDPATALHLTVRPDAFHVVI